MKNDGEEMSIILTLAQLEGSEPNFYKQAKNDERRWRELGRLGNCR